MFSDTRRELQNIIEGSLKLFDGMVIPAVLIDVPADKQHGEFSCNSCKCNFLIITAV